MFSQASVTLERSELTRRPRDRAASGAAGWRISLFDPPAGRVPVAGFAFDFGGAAVSRSESAGRMRRGSPWRCASRRAVFCWPAQCGGGGGRVGWQRDRQRHGSAGGADSPRDRRGPEDTGGRAAAGVAAGAVGGLIADGVSGGQHVTKVAKGKSRRRRDGDSGTHEARARPFARWRGAGCEAVARGVAQAGERLFAGLRRAAPWAVRGLAARQSVRR